MKNLIKAIVAASKQIQEAGGIDKNSEVGFGRNSYKGVKDSDVKNVIGKAMVDNGLCILPTSVEDETTISRWEEDFRGEKKTKQSVFCKVRTKYILCHESGEKIEIAGCGHGVDSQDKAIGKATTYALKYALIYSFMVEVGRIQDADATHSDSYETKSNKQTTNNTPKQKKREITPHRLPEVIIWALKRNKTIEQIEHHYLVTPDQKNIIVSSMADENFIAAYNLSRKLISEQKPMDHKVLVSMKLSKESISILKTLK